MAQGAQYVLAMAKEVIDRIDQLGQEGLEKSMPLLRDLRVEIVEALAIGRESKKESIESAVVGLLSGGWIVGALENQSGVAKRGFSETLYWTAMVSVWGLLGKNEKESTGFEVEEAFSVVAAYYVSRVNTRTALDEVLGVIKAVRPNSSG